MNTNENHLPGRVSFVWTGVWNRKLVGLSGRNHQRFSQKANRTDLQDPKSGSGRFDGTVRNRGSRRNSMTIKKKIWISNILMVLIPVLLTTVVIVFCMNTSLGSYWHSLESMYQDENGMQSAMSLIYTYQQELWDTNWSERCVPGSMEVVQSDRMYRLERQLSDMGYHIRVEKNGNELYSNIPEEDIVLAMEAAGESIFTAKTMTLSNEKITIVKNTFLHEQKVLSILALNSEPRSGSSPSYLQDYILRYIVLFAVLFFLAITLVNVLLSWWISRSVLIPLNILSVGTQEIREGNLDTKLRYEKKDEFGAVCRTVLPRHRKNRSGI